MSEGKEAVNNEYGMSQADEAKARRAIRKALRTGGEMPEIEASDAPAIEDTGTEVVATDSVEASADGTQAKADTPEAVVEVVAADAADPLADLPEEWKEKVVSQLKAAKEESDKYKHRIASDDGRVSAFQNKYEEARRALAAKEAEIAALKKAPPKALKDIDSPRIKQALESGEEGLVELMEEARAQSRKEMEEEMATLRRDFEARLNPIQEQRHAQDVQDFNRKLNERYDNWQQVVYQTDENGRVVVGEDKQPIFSEAWATYILDQPPNIQAAITRVDSAEEAIWALDTYADWLKRTGRVKEEAAPVVAASADAIQKKRDADLKRKAPPTGHGVALAPTPTLDLNNSDVETKLRKLARESIKKNDPSLYSPKNL